MKREIPKAYEPNQYEDAVYAAWEQSGFFNPDRLPGNRTEPFTIVLPPPNVTGTLHMGHAVMLAIEDIMVRFARLRGKRALWIPGTDHAAIATQTKVEKTLIASGLKDPRRDLGRDVFLKHVEAFASQSHDTIVNQVRKMGASIDWSREAYTLDERRNLAVRTVFKMMYDDGLIYRGNRVINWCPRCKSTIADDEVAYKEEKTKFYYFKYGPIIIGTARPETKFLDKTIVVHPKDERYKDIVGKKFEIEWIDGKVMANVVADEAADMEFGTGAMTITPAHSAVDFEIAKRNGLEVVQIIDEAGDFTAAAGDMVGKNARASREEIVSRLAAKGLVDHIDEAYVHNLSVCYRCDTPIEPMPKLQWFIDVNKPFVFRASTHAPIDGIKDKQEVTLKSLMQHVVRSEQVKIMPDRFDKTYFNWVDNLRDWNISRQIWFGHRVPVWYRGEEMVVGEAPAGEGWDQDPDTLDTWFSAGLWTISTLGWPDKTTDFDTFHPTSVLETGYDIIFFWVARMILMTTYAVGEVPFKTVYLHGLVRDEKGRKMSKSLDNIIDPLDMIKEYGADATRLSLVIGSTPGNDSKLSAEKVAGYRNFTNKLWNISRFVLTSVESPLPTTHAPQTLADRWILSRLADVTEMVTAHLEKHELSAAGELLRDFTWSDFADWYLEIAKVQKGASTDAILLHVLEHLLILWHPFMPFVTETIWKEWKGEETSPLMVATWPDDVSMRDEDIEKKFRLFQDVVIMSRLAKVDTNWPGRPEQRVDFTIVSRTNASFYRDQLEIILRLSGIGKVTENANVVEEQDKTDDVLSYVGSDFVLFMTKPQLDPVSKEKERARLTKEADELRAYVEGLETKLDNKEFIGKAPAKVVDGLRGKRDEAAAKLKAIEEQLNAL